MAFRLSPGKYGVLASACLVCMAGLAAAPEEGMAPVAKLDAADIGKVPSGWKLDGNAMTGREASVFKDEKAGLAVKVKFGETTPWKWAGLNRAFPGESLKGRKAPRLVFWFKGDGSSNHVSLGFSESSGESWSARIPLRDREWRLVSIDIKEGGENGLSTGGWKKKNGTLEAQTISWFGFGVENSKEMEFSFGEMSLCGTPEYACVDLSPICNMAFEDEVEGDGKGGWTDQGVGNSLTGAPLGRQLYDSVPFDIIDPAKKGVSCLVLRGKEKPSFPLEATLPLHRKAATIFVLHTAAWASGKAADYVIEYEDGGSCVFPILCGRDISNWWGPADLKNFRAVWKNEENRGFGFTVLSNPEPQRQIKSIAFKGGNTPVVCILAATLSDSPYLRPEAKALSPDQSGWFEIRPRKSIAPGSACDFSFLLDSPAGKHGFLKAKADKYLFEDGSPAKFFGINACSFIRPHDEIDRMLDLFARMGVNVVRLHHMNPIWANPNIYNPYVERLELWDWAMERVDYFIAEAKKRGIYTYIDMADHHPFRRDDGANLSDLSNGASVELFYVPEMMEKFKAHMKEWLLRRNIHTGLRYCDDPAVAFVELTNENCMSNMIRLGRKPKEGRDRKLFEELWIKFLKERHGDDAKLKEAWTDGEGNCALREGESLAKGNIEILPFIGAKTPSSGRYNPAAPAARIADANRFLIWVEDAWQRTMGDYYHELGGKAVLVGNNWPGGFDFRAKAYVDSMGCHTYWNHPPEPYQPAVRNLTSSPYSFTKSQLADKPLFVGEVNYCYANPYRAEGLPIVGAYGAFQGIGGFAWFAGPTESDYEETPGSKEIRSFDMTAEPIHLTQFPLAAFLYHAAVGEGRELTEVCYSEDDDFAAYSADPSKKVWEVLPYMVKSRRLLLDGQPASKEGGVMGGLLSLLGCGDEARPADATIPSGITAGGDYKEAKRLLRLFDCPYADASRKLRRDLPELDEESRVVARCDRLAKEKVSLQDFAAGTLSKWGLGMKKGDALISSTGELSFNPEAGVFTIDTAKAKAFIGFTGGSRIDLEGASLKADTKFSSVIMAAVDGRPVAESGRLLVAAAARCEPSGWVWSSEMNNKPESFGKPPMRAEPVKGLLTIKSQQAGSLKAYSLSPEGRRLAEVPCSVKDGALTLTLGESKSMQYELCAPGEVSAEVEKGVSFPAGAEFEREFSSLARRRRSPEESAIIAFEGESPLRHNFNNSLAGGSQSLSAGKWLSHSSKDGAPSQITASYEFNVSEPGDYKLWVREFWIQLASTVKYRIDGGDWLFADRCPYFRDVAPKVSNWMWVDVDQWGVASLGKGRHTLDVCVETPNNYDRKYQAAFDLFIFVKGDFLPKDYKLK